MIIKKSEKSGTVEIKTKCKACGKTARIDDKEKLSSHIKKNPPKYDDVNESDKKSLKNNEVEKMDIVKLNKEIGKKISK